MENSCFEFIEKVSEEESREILFRNDDITAIEKSFVLGEDGSTPEYVLAFYTRNLILRKNSNCLVVHFASLEERDKAYEEVKSKMNPTTFEARWYPI